MDKKTKSIYMLPSRDKPQNEKCTQTGNKGMEKICLASGNEKRPGVATLVSEKRELKTKAIDKEGHCVMIKGFM